MKKILILVFLFTSSCSTTKEFLPGIVPDFITNYFKEKVKPYDALPEFVNSINMDLIWGKKFSGEIEDEDGVSYLNLYKFNEEMYIPTNEKKVHIVLLENGELKKSIDTELDIFSSITVDSKLFYFGSKQATVTAINHENGSLLWQRLMTSEIMSISRFSANNEAIYVRTNDSKISAIDVNTGKFLWVNSQLPPSLSIRGTSSVLLEDDNVFVGLDDGKIVSFNSKNGDIIWQTQLPAAKAETIIDRLNDIDGSMIIDNGTLFAISYQGSIAAIDSFTGQVLWSREASSLYGLTANDDNIFYIDDDGVLWCLEKFSGRPVWKQEKFFKRLIGDPVLYKNFIIAKDVENYLHIINSDDGKILGRIKTKKSIQSIYSDYDSLYLLEKDFSLKKYQINIILQE
jgi:outer membrane protein assembly factor BamB